jgi:phosphatidylglycerophosphate synthase
VKNETAIIGSSSGEEIFYSHLVTFYGIPVSYFLIIALIILAILYLLCRVKRKDRHSMQKSSYIKLFIALFAPLFIYNLYNLYDGLRFAAGLIYLDPCPFITTILFAFVASLIESIFPYLEPIRKVE